MNKKEKTYNYTYLVIPTLETFKHCGKVYFGVHFTDDLEDNYICSSKILKKWCIKHPNDYYREIISFFDTKQEALKAEYEIIHSHLGKDYCLNLREGGEGGNTFILKTNTELIEIKKKISEAGKRPCSEETKLKISKANKGKRHPNSEETRKKQSEANKGKKKPPRTEEHRKHLSESHKGLKSPIKGKHKVWDNKELNIYHMEY